MGLLTTAEAMRDEALREIAKTREWEVAKAADDLVVALGGERKLPHVGGLKMRLLDGSVLLTRPSGRLSQGDAAEQVLAENDGPMSVGDLLLAVEQRGATVGGEKREINLSSALSRDDRFKSVRIDGQHMWMLAKEAVNAATRPGRQLQLDEEDEG